MYVRALDNRSRHVRQAFLRGFDERRRHFRGGREPLFDIAAERLGKPRVEHRIGVRGAHRRRAGRKFDYCSVLASGWICIRWRFT